MAPNDPLYNYAESLLNTARILVNADVLSPSRHGNLSVRVPGTDTLVLASESLHLLTAEQVLSLDIDGSLISGKLTPVTAEILPMHTEVYKHRSDIGAVVHVHSPYATTFAVASKPIPCVSESLARWGVVDPVPVAAYGPRGSREAVQNILDVVRTDTQAVLLENHGILVMSGDLPTATKIVLALEEAAFLALNAHALGGPKVMSPEMARKAQSHKSHFETVTPGRE